MKLKEEEREVAAKLAMRHIARAVYYVLRRWELSMAALREELLDALHRWSLKHGYDPKKEG